MAQETHTEDEHEAIAQPGVKLEINIADCLKVIAQQEAQIARLRLENAALIRTLSKNVEANDGTTPTQTR